MLLHEQRERWVEELSAGRGPAGGDVTLTLTKTAAPRMDSFCNAVWGTDIVIFARGGFFVIVDSSLSHGPLLATLWTIAYQTPLSIGFL